MKKLLIATTALVATAGMASADITITGAANAGYYSGLSKKDGTAAVKAVAALGTASEIAFQKAEVAVTKAAYTAAAATVVSDTADGSLLDADVALARTTLLAYNESLAVLDAIDGTAKAAATVGTYTKSGIYSNAGIVATMTGSTDGGITFSASVDAEAGTEVDTGDFELDGAASGSFGLGAVSVTGGFGTITFDDNGIDNLYDDDLTAADVKYSTTIGGVTLTAAMNAQTSVNATTGLAAGNDTSLSASYTSGAMTFSGSTSDAIAGTSASVAVSYVINDNFTVRADTDQAAGAEAVQSIGVTTALNGVSIVADTSNDST